MNPAARQLADQDAPYTILEICPGIFRIPIPLPRNSLRELNAYLVRGRGAACSSTRASGCRSAARPWPRASGPLGRIKTLWTSS